MLLRVLQSVKSVQERCDSSWMFQVISAEADRKAMKELLFKVMSLLPMQPHIIHSLHFSEHYKIYPIYFHWVLNAMQLKPANLKVNDY